MDKKKRRFQPLKYIGAAVGLLVIFAAVGIFCAVGIPDNKVYTFEDITNGGINRVDYAAQHSSNGSIITMTKFNDYSDCTFKRVGLLKDSDNEINYGGMVTSEMLYFDENDELLFTLEHPYGYVKNLRNYLSCKTWHLLVKPDYTDVLSVELDGVTEYYIIME